MSRVLQVRTHYYTVGNHMDIGIPNGAIIRSVSVHGLPEQEVKEIVVIYEEER